MIAALEASAWPIDGAAAALDALARAAGLVDRAAAPSARGARAGGSDAHTAALESTAAQLGIELEPASGAYADVEPLIRNAAPALLRVQREDAMPTLIAAVRASRRRVSLIGPDHVVRSVDVAAVRAAICEPKEAPLRAETDALLDEMGVVPSRRTRARRAIIGERLAGTAIAECWLVRLPPAASVRQLASSASLLRKLAVLIGAHAIEYTLWILSWWIIGRAALDGRLDTGWLAAWSLMLATLIPFHLLVTWLQGRLSIDAGGLLKQRLLAGALRLEPEEIRTEGAGQLLGRVIESQAIEALALGGGFLALVAGIELVMAAVILVFVSVALPVVLFAWMAVVLAIGGTFWIRRRPWTQSRLAMTHDLVERMVGHRTRIAQERPEHWHDGEDESLDRYVVASIRMDRSAAALMALAPRGWLLIGLLAIMPSFISGADPQQLAISLGGLLLAYRAFRRLSAGMTYLAGAAIAWDRAADVFHAAARPRESGSANAHFTEPVDAERNGRPLIEARNLLFRYDARNDPVLRGCSLQISRGDRLLLMGPSGGGKSTLASLVSGLRAPASGVLLLDGMDRQTLGVDLWRRQVTLVPQFHENHVFLGAFAFNLLMGTGWPATCEELDRAELLCRELGLGDLLERMPAGVMQQVGETGWQLSHGECSRLYIARALLQRPECVVLDETFAQLDPENLQRALTCVLNHVPTVMVIAHP